MCFDQAKFKVFEKKKNERKLQFKLDEVKVKRVMCIRKYIYENC